MQSETLECEHLSALTMERPSEEFLRAIAELLETDANDLLSEMGYVPPEAVVVEAERIAA